MDAVLRAECIEDGGRLEGEDCVDCYEEEEFESVLERLCGPEADLESDSDEDEEVESEDPDSESEGE